MQLLVPMNLMRRTTVSSTRAVEEKSYVVFHLYHRYVRGIAVKGERFVRAIICAATTLHYCAIRHRFHVTSASSPQRLRIGCLRLVMNNQYMPWV